MPVNIINHVNMKYFITYEVFVVISNEKEGPKTFGWLKSLVTKNKPDSRNACSVETI